MKTQTLGNAHYLTRAQYNALKTAGTLVLGDSYYITDENYQLEITSSNKLSADLVASGTTNVVPTATDAANWNAKQDALPTTTTADLVLKSTSTAGTVEWGEAGSSVTVSSSGVTDGTNTYNASDKMAKASPTGTGALSINRKASTTTGNYSVAVGYNGTASGNYSTAEGYETQATGDYSHAEGNTTTASGSSTHAEGKSTRATEEGAHSEGNLTQASGYYAHAEGYNTNATAQAAHAEGQNGSASAQAAHKEGADSVASGYASHAEGNTTTASGSSAHAEGYGTTAQRAFQHVVGEYNVLDTGGSSTGARGSYVEIVGNGTGTSARSNARTLDWDGNEVLAGKMTAAGGIDYKNASSVSLGGLKFVKCSQDEYEALSTVDNNTLYIIINKYTITGTATNATINSSTSYSGTIKDGETITLTVGADGSSYKLPTTVTVSGATYVYTRTSDTAGTIALSNPTANISVSVTGVSV